MTASTIGLLALMLLCYTLQSFGNKLYAMSYKGPETAATPVFSLVYGLAVSLVTLCVAGLRFAPSRITVTLGLCNGAALFLFNLSAISAAKKGPYAFQSMMMLFGSILTALVFSWAYWGDRLGTRRLIGIAVMLVSFVLFNMDGFRLKGSQRSFYVWAAVLFLANGAYGVLMDAQQRVMNGAERDEMIILTFGTSAVISALYLPLSRRRNAVAAFRMGRKAGLCAAVSSAGAAAAILLLMICLRRIPAAVLYTIVNGGLLVISALLSALVLRERLTRWMIAGICAAVISLVLLA